MEAELILKEKPDKLRLTKRKLRTIMEALFGEEAATLVEAIGDRVGVNEFELAEQLGWEIAKVRQILYRLHEYHLTIYRRKKDRQKGWYISYWTFKKDQVKPMLEKLRMERLKQLQERLERELEHKGNFYLCPHGCVRMDFDQAAEYQFKCPECGRVLHLQDNTRTIEFLKERIRILTE